MQLLYPSEDFNSVIDIHRQEQIAFESRAIKTSIFDFAAFYDDKLRVKPSINSPVSTLYRGWMLSSAEYKTLYKLAQQKDLQLLTTPSQYDNCHLLPNWYDILCDYTPKTLITTDLAQLPSLFKQLDCAKVFVKDFVKSDTTSDSIAESVSDIEQIAHNIVKYRGKIDGGICLREYIPLKANTERRYFVFNHQSFSSDKQHDIPTMIKDIAEIIDSPFFSIDTCYDQSGKLWLIEIGDGQVSDLKEWQIDTFVDMFVSCLE